MIPSPGIRTINGVRWVRGRKIRGVGYRPTFLLDERGAIVAQIKQLAPFRAVWGWRNEEAFSDPPILPVACREAIVKALPTDERYVFVQRGRLISSHDKIPLPAVLRRYRCTTCRHEWMDVWDCISDNNCPKCSASNSPYGTTTLKDAT